MSRSNLIGVIGGALIALSVFLTGSGFEFSTSDLVNSTMALVLFIAGIAVMIFLLIGRRTLAAYSAVAATTLTIVMVVDGLRGGGLSLTVSLVVLLVGVLLAIIATFGGSGRRSNKA